jgi:RsmE family RNA methyltransferase
MNRILFEPCEIADGVASCDGVRASHILSVLHGEVGQILKTGEVDGPIGTGEIVGISGEGASPIVRVRVNHDEKGLEPWCDLVLAPPRPRVMKRLLPQLAALGVGTIVLVGAKKVEKDFWGATLLKEENYRPLLVDGLMQSGTSALPRLLVRRNFRAFVRDELDGLFPSRDRVVAHPYGASRVRSGFAAGGRLLLAVGPEGGWTDEEVELLESHGFARYSLGPRILRTDTAVVALLARLERNPSMGD